MLATCEPFEYRDGPQQQFTAGNSHYRRLDRHRRGMCFGIGSSRISGLRRRACGTGRGEVAGQSVRPADSRADRHHRAIPSPPPSPRWPRPWARRGLPDWSITRGSPWRARWKCCPSGPPPAVRSQRDWPGGGDPSVSAALAAGAGRVVNISSVSGGLSAPYLGAVSRIEVRLGGDYGRAAPGASHMGDRRFQRGAGSHRYAHLGEIDPHRRPDDGATGAGPVGACTKTIWQRCARRCNDRRKRPRRSSASCTRWSMPWRPSGRRPAIFSVGACGSVSNR